MLFVNLHKHSTFYIMYSWWECKILNTSGIRSENVKSAYLKQQHYYNAILSMTIHEEGIEIKVDWSH